MQALVVPPLASACKTLRLKASGRRQAGAISVGQRVRFSKATAAPRSDGAWCDGLLAITACAVIERSSRSMSGLTNLGIVLVHRGVVAVHLAVTAKTARGGMAATAGNQIATPYGSCPFRAMAASGSS